MFKRLLDYLILPSEMTRFEADYLRRMNRIAALFLWAHLPLLPLVALLCGTGPLRALGLTLFTLLGVYLVRETFPQPRHQSMAYGFCAMCLGGLLVHFGQGPMQIEMHFYFFTMLALLSVFGNPLVIVLAATTVLLHHTILYFLLPRSVFNYDASIWAVAVHGIFVFVESIAACFVARSFFDDVIGLEQIVKQRTAEIDERHQAMRLVLDHVGQGLLTLDHAGVPSEERSAVLSRWLGEPPPGQPFWAWIQPHDSHVAEMLRLSWEQLFLDVLPLDLVLEQMPRRMNVGACQYELSYTPILTGERLERVLLVVTDTTAQLEKEHFEAEQREMIAAVEKLLLNKDAFVDFFGEANVLVKQVTLPEPERSPLPEVKRQVHTLKGTSSIFGLTHIASFCHELENRMKESAADISPADREELSRRWRRLSVKFEKLIGNGQRRIEVTPAEHAAVLHDVLRGAPRHQIARALSVWKLQPTQGKLEQFADQLRDLSRRLGKGPVRVEVSANDLRLAPEHWSGFWGTFSHVVRNAVDHGMETVEERALAGKAPTGQIRLSTSVVGEQFVIEIADDGRGIDWARIARRAAAAGLPTDTRAALTEALFSDGISTKEEVTEISGRGVGMGAVRAACQYLDGEIHIESELGQGTTLRFAFPASRMMGDEQALPRPRATASTAPPRAQAASLLRAPQEAQWQVLAPLIAEAAADLFSCYGASLTWQPDGGTDEQAWTASAYIGFGGERFEGALTLALTLPLIERIGGLRAEADAWGAELANQLLGRLKNKLLPFGLVLYPGTPVCLRGADVARQVSPESRVFTFTGEGAVAWVCFDATLDPMFLFQALPLAGGAALSEGEMLLF